MDSTHFIREGIAHITDPGGYDHMLFLLVLYCNLEWQQWKKTIVLISAFTIGHSITLALAALNCIAISGHAIELMIASSILLTAISGLVKSYVNRDMGITIQFLITILFGLIHGAGFSSYFKMIAGETHFVQQLFLFNFGVEIGQLIILVFLVFLRFLADYFKVGDMASRIALSLSITLSLLMLIERI